MPATTLQAAKNLVAGIWRYRRIFGMNCAALLVPLAIQNNLAEPTETWESSW
jgi:hypothetical protein